MNGSRNDPDGNASRVVVIGCVAGKRATASPARDLYQSTLFRGRRAYAEAAGKPWFIMSALYGLIDPDEVVTPYDVSMRQLDRVQRKALGEQVVDAIEQRVGSLAGCVVELHAGNEYAEAIAEPLRTREATLYRPLQGLRLGMQLQWYKRWSPVRQL
jgi:hypothetical protein